MNEHEPNVIEQSYAETGNSFNWKFWIIIIIPVILVIGLIILSITLSTKTIEETEFIEGATFELKQNKEASFVVGDEEHNIKISGIGLDSISIVIESEPIKLELKIGEEVQVDINKDGLEDIIVKLNSINNGVPEIYIRNIHRVRKEKFEERKQEVVERAKERFSNEDLSNIERKINNAGNFSELEKYEEIVNNSDSGSINFHNYTTEQTNLTGCNEKWQCGFWTQCDNGIKERYCIEINECDLNIDAPIMRKECEDVTTTNNETNETEEDYTCDEEWECYDWGECINNKKYRTCEDLNYCGTYEDKPELHRVCEDGTVCDENWECGEWNDCVEGFKERTCEDVNSCGTHYYKPEMEKSCDYPGPIECENIEDIIERDYCYYNLAQQNLDYSICHYISGEEVENSTMDSGVTNFKKDSCYIHISIEKPEDYSICPYIEETEDKDLCYKRAAIALDDITLCEEIGSINLRESCINHVNSVTNY